MKSVYEKVVPVAGSSWSYLDRKLDDGIPFEWHHHPEYELTLTLNSEGFRYVGDNIDPYSDGDLVLLGSNLPHSWNSIRVIDASLPHMAKVAWFRKDWIEAVIADFPELHRIGDMLTKARSGIVFSKPVANQVRPVLDRLLSQPDDARLVGLLSALQCLSRDPDMRMLLPTPDGKVETREPRLDRVLDHLHAHYTEPVSIKNLSDLACMTQSGFHRLFRRHMRATPLQYVARLRIGRACALLMEARLKIAAIATAVGYESVAQFNKEFRRQKGMTPREFGRG